MPDTPCFTSLPSPTPALKVTASSKTVDKGSKTKAANPFSFSFSFWIVNIFHGNS